MTLLDLMEVPPEQTAQPKTGKDIGLEGFWADAPIISMYTREQALADGNLVDVSEWASRDNGFLGGYTCPVTITRALWDKVDIDAKPKSARGCQSTRGRAHDVLYMSSLACRAALRRSVDRGQFRIKLGGRVVELTVVMDGDGVTIGFPEDF